MSPEKRRISDFLSIPSRSNFIFPWSSKQAAAAAVVKTRNEPVLPTCLGTHQRQCFCCFPRYCWWWRFCCSCWCWWCWCLLVLAPCHTPSPGKTRDSFERTHLPPLVRETSSKSSTARRMGKNSIQFNSIRPGTGEDAVSRSWYQPSPPFLVALPPRLSRASRVLGF